MNNIDRALDQMSNLAIAPMKTTATLGARVMVLGAFLDMAFRILRHPIAPKSIGRFDIVLKALSTMDENNVMLPPHVVRHCSILQTRSSSHRARNQSWSRATPLEQ
ncbi:hypothetical protein P0D75_37995 [Paraburkholderia sediminicola]|uniref:hypothetical protein n=1 Tax=Paraburkholderia sediminicola TaxID=458836 RepID=UPI0038B96F32